MDKFATNGTASQLAEFETPFADASYAREEHQDEAIENYQTQYFSDFESPFAATLEANEAADATSPLAGEFVQFLGELNDSEFSNTIYELAAELEDTWTSKITNEVAMGDKFVPFATQQAAEYFSPFINETESMIDRVSQQFSGNNIADNNESSIERFFGELEFDHSRFSPAQEQLFGGIFDKIKSVVKKGVDLAKKGISVVGKFLPINLILNMLKGLIRPLLDKVLKFAIGKLPQNLRPYAQTLATKFLNLETPSANVSNEGDVSSTGELEAIQTELDNHIANLVFSREESEADNLMMEYESSSDNLDRTTHYETGGLNLPSLDAAREQFINELKTIQPGQSAAPAIERFLPAVILALQPVIKMAMSIIGRQKIINFLAGLLGKLVGKYVPENVATPLAASIIDVGMSAIGFETYETNKPDVAYETIANTIQETIQNMGELDEAALNDNEAMTAQLLEAFETAAADNFPSQYIREELRPSQQPGVWVLKPRNGPRHLYKKYSRAFNISIDPQTAKTITVFRGVPLANFLRDKLGLDPAKPLQARVHLYQAIRGTRLSHIGKFEKVQGLGSRHSWVQLHPLTKQAAALLIKEPALGKDLPQGFTAKRTRIAMGQRFYYLEINGAVLKVAPHENRNYRQQSGISMNGKPGSSGDIQGVINFVKSEIRFNYYFSEEEAKSVVEKLNQNDFLGAAMSIRYSVKNVLHEMLVKNISSKVKIIHEAMPEMYLENYPEQEQSSPFGSLNGAGNIILNTGKELLSKLVEKLIEKISALAHTALSNCFKTRAAEFKQAQAEPQDGVTIKINWLNIPGMSAIKSIVSAIRGKLAIPNLSDLSLPSIPDPDVQIIAGKKFD